MSDPTVSKWQVLPQVFRLTTLLAAAGLAASCLPDPGGQEGADNPNGMVDPGTGVPGDHQAATPEQLQTVREQIPGRDLQEQPPKVVSAQLFAINKTREGNARLELKFEEALPTRLKFLFDGAFRELNDEGVSPDLAAGDGIYTSVVLAQQAELDESELARRQGRPTDQTPEVAESSSPIYPTARMSLVITHLGVVNDLERVSDPCTSFVSPSATTSEWSFGYLMNHMANTSTTGVSADTFARSWLDNWRNTKTINGDTVTPPRLSQGLSVPQYVLNEWIRASRMRSNGSLDPNTNPPLKMEKAPFRLLAIVYRPDLRKNRFFGEGLAGELRFVFGVLDQNPTRSPWGQPCRPMDIPTLLQDFKNQTVILEYAVDKSREADVRSWAKEWNDLASFWDWSTDAPTATYRTKLQGLTDRVVRAGIGGANRANRSALIRIRTNETADRLEWRLREFRIGPKSATASCSPANGTCVPVPDTVKQTPRAIRNGTTLLGNYINANFSAVLSETHKVPTTYSGSTFLGGQAINPGSSNDINEYWRAPNLVGDAQMVSLMRQRFSLNTCNGCHTAETGTHFAHIPSRLWDEESLLSRFMKGGDPENDPSLPFVVTDPATGEERRFNEFARREQDLFDLITQSSAAAMMFQPTTRVH